LETLATPTSQAQFSPVYFCAPRHHGYIHLFHLKEQWHPFVNIAIKYQVPQKKGIFTKCVSTDLQTPQISSTWR